MAAQPTVFYPDNTISASPGQLIEFTLSNTVTTFGAPVIDFTMTAEPSDAVTQISFVQNEPVTPEEELFVWSASVDTTILGIGEHVISFTGSYLIQGNRDYVSGAGLLFITVEDTADTTPPSINSITASSTSVQLNTSGANTSATVTFTVNATDDVGITSKSMNNGASYSSNSGNNWYFTKTFDQSAYSIGSQNQTFTVTMGDAAGNTSTASITVTIVKSDVTPPSIGTRTLRLDSTSGTAITSLSLGSTSTQWVYLDFTATDTHSTISTISVDQGYTYYSTSGSTRYYRKNYSATSYPYGSSSETITVTVTDSAGNSSSATKSLTVTRNDTSAPTISSFTASDTTITLTTSSQSQTVTFTVVATDNISVTDVTLNNGATYSSKSGNNWYFTKTYSYTDPNYASGTQNETLIATAVDAAGNTATSTIEVIVTVVTLESVTADYYISATVNINDSVFQEGGFLGFRLSKIDKTSGGITNYNLPSGSASMTCGAVQGSGIGGVSVTGGLTTTLTVSVNQSGVMSSSIAITGSGMTATTVDDPAKAQSVYWSGIQSTPTVTSSTADVLTSSYSDADLQAAYASEFSAITSAYSGDRISQWTIQLPRIDATNDRQIQQYAMAKNTSFPNVFQNGDNIVLETTFPYSVSVLDIYGQSVEIVPNTLIYAVLEHQDSAPAMEG